MTIRNARPEEFLIIGQLMVEAYSSLDGFPKPDEQPAYYQMLANVGALTENPATELFVAATGEDQIAGAVVFFSDMKFYGSGGAATREENAAGFRLLAVSSAHRRMGIGKFLTQGCIEKAREIKRAQIIIHTTMAMQTAWKMYEKIGFKRSEDLDFMQGTLKVFGFRMSL